MATVPRVKSLKREDYPRAPEWFDQLLLVLNQNLGDMSQALSNGLTQTENGRAEFKVVDVMMPLEYPTWRVVGQPGQPTYTNSWTANLTAGFGVGASFRMLPDGYVELRGLVAHAAVSLPSAIFTLPPGYRPPINYMFAVPSHDGAPEVSEIRVHSTGVVQDISSLSPASAMVYLSLSGIRFQAGGTAGGIAARVEPFGAPFPLSVRLTNKWPVKTCQVVNVFDVTGQQPGIVGPVIPYWQTREAGMLTLEALWGLQPGRSYRVTLLVTAG